MTITLEAPAKINWFLSVLDRRGDGYHNIVSLMQAVDLFDLLTFEDSDEIEVVSDLAEVPVEENLVYRAATLLKATHGGRRGARITLRKVIPVAAGLGGGSSDAACALVGLDRLWGLGLGTQRLRALGAGIGSDVPFFIGSGYALAEGRGELLTPVQNAPEIPVLLVNPGIPVSAGWAYESVQIGLTKKGIDIKLFCQCLEDREYDKLRLLLVNDLEQAVISSYPEIGRIKEMLYAEGAAVAAMSGSGSTVFGVFRTVEQAGRAADNMGRYWRRVVRTLGSVGA